MRRVSVSLSKGGVAKTTTAVNLSACLASLGHQTLLIDTDTQSQCAKMLGVKPESGLAEILLGEEVAPFKARDNLWLLGGSPALAQAKRLIAREDIAPQEILSRALRPFDDKYDFAILDTSPGWDSLSVNILFYATEILCPISLENLSVDGFLNFLSSLEPIREHRKIEVDYVLPTFLDGRVKKSQEILEHIQKHFGDRVCNPIRYSARLSEAPAFGQTIFEFSPRDQGAIDYAKLAGRILRNGEKT